MICDAYYCLSIQKVRISRIKFGGKASFIITFKKIINAL
jgi:hypothetical protein